MKPAERDWKQVAASILQAVIESEGVSFDPWPGFGSQECIAIADELEPLMLKVEPPDVANIVKEIDYTSCPTCCSPEHNTLHYYSLKGALHGACVCCNELFVWAPMNKGCR